MVLDSIQSLVEHVADKPELNQHVLTIAYSFTKNSFQDEIPVQISVLNILTSICAHSYPIAEWEKYLIIIRKGLASDSLSMNCAAMKTLEQFAHSSTNDTSQRDALSLAWWKEALESSAHLWTVDFPAIRCLSCNLISHLSRPVILGLEVRFFQFC